MLQHVPDTGLNQENSSSVANTQTLNPSSQAQNDELVFILNSARLLPRTSLAKGFGASSPLGVTPAISVRT